MVLPGQSTGGQAGGTSATVGAAEAAGAGGRHRPLAFHCNRGLDHVEL